MRASNPLLLGSLLVAASTLPQAASAAPPKAKGRPQVSLEEVSVMLASSQEDELRSALEAAAQLPARDVVSLIDDRVRSGLTRVLVDVAIDTLLLLDDKSAQALWNDLTQHRRPEVRSRALEALGRLKAVNAEALLVRGLGDQNAGVRDAAAAALAESNARTATPQLSHALERGVEGAGPALAKLAKPDDLGRLLDFVGKLPLSSVTPMLSTLLARRDLNEGDKLKVVSKVASLQGDDATNGSEALLGALPSDASPRVRRVLSDAVEKGNKP